MWVLFDVYHLFNQKHIKIHIHPYKYKIYKYTPAKEMVKYQFSDPKKMDKNLLLISYHSIGKNNPQILRWKEGYLQGTITFDTKGYSGWSSLCDKRIKKTIKSISINTAHKFLKKLQDNYIARNNSKYIQTKNIKFKFPKNFIFFPLQTINDSVMLHSFYHPIKLIKDIVKILNKHDIPLVVKQHPRCNSEILKELLIKYKKHNKIILFNGSIHDAISKAKTIYTINSGVGFEALLHLKPVITFGKSDYMSMTKNIKNLDIIKKSPFYSLDTQKKNRIKKFLYYYISTKCLFLNDDNKLQEIIDNFIINYLNNKDQNE